MHKPFMALALVFSVAVTALIILLMERHVVRLAQPVDPTTAFEPSPENPG
jgi:hypothetical protein